MIINNGFRGHQPAFTGQKQVDDLKYALRYYADTRLPWCAKKGMFDGLTKEEYRSKEIQEMLNKKDIESQKIVPNNAIAMMRKHLEERLDLEEPPEVTLGDVLRSLFGFKKPK